MTYYKYKLWSDLNNDQERVEFLLSGRAVETGIIAPAIVEDVAAAFAFRASHQPAVQADAEKMCECGSDMFQDESGEWQCLSDNHRTA